MNSIIYQNNKYEIKEGESILSCLIRHGVDYPHSCRSGICQSCLIKSGGNINAAWQEGIPDTLKMQGYFLACLARPEEEIDVKPPLSAECDIPAIILCINQLNYNVIQLLLTVDDVEPWVPGQYLNLINTDGTIRSYSIANLPIQDRYIELHIKIYEQGSMSTWLKEKAKASELIYVRGPIGKCFYFNPKNLFYDILLVGTGTGLSPLVGIAKDALSKNHDGNIMLLHGGITEKDWYYQKELNQLAKKYPRFQFKQCALFNEIGEKCDSIEQAALEYIHDPNQLHVFVCGPKETIDKIKTKIFCSGVPSAQILSDAFTFCAT